MWFIFTIITIIAWSGSDLFSKIGSKTTDKNSHWKMVTAVGLVMGTHAIVQIISGVPFAFSDIITYLPVSAMYIISMLFGYIGLRYIELSISSPICNSSGAITALLCFFVLKQSMSGLQLFAIVLICIGVICLSMIERNQTITELDKTGTKIPQKYKTGILAIIFPILYCLIDGAASFTDIIFLDKYINELQANIAYELTFLFVGLIALFYVVVIKKEKLVLWNEKPKLAGALCETAGQFTYIFAMAANGIVAAPAIASYSIFSVIFSRIFLKEKLTKKHYAVIALVVIGIGILGIE
ncbi:MAG: EamA family transporter [Oscillospiraceae bacterium]